MSAPVQRRPDGTPYPADILFLAEFFGHTPEYVMRNPRTYAQPSGRMPPDSEHLTDPDRFGE